MKIRCSISLGQYASIKEDVSYLESGQGGKILQPDTRRFLRQAFERAEMKLARREEKCRAFSGVYETDPHTTQKERYDE
ncbi:MAG: hypothetical protein LBC60_12355 [Spirochaetaceae bacterium]|jgi:hypothetical protein|nr:hypothetical protein [Spirochaetaceae bacterium]